MEVVRTTFLYLKQGGWIMIPLALASIVLWAMMLERLTRLRVLRKQDLTVDDAIRVVRGGASSVEGEGLRARLVRAFLERRTGFSRLDVDILRQCAMREQPGLSRYLAMVAVLVSVAPLLGLLGTVLGMIETFQVISVFGTGNATAMANGISIALITTEVGLLVAVPGLLLSGILMQQSIRLRTQLEEDLTILTRIVRRPGDSECSQVDEARHGDACRGGERGRARAGVAPAPAMAGSEGRQA
jgi:biopolymer transport protein ExbB